MGMGEKQVHIYFCISDIEKAEVETTEQPPEEFIRQMGKHC